MKYKQAAKNPNLVKTKVGMGGILHAAQPFPGEDQDTIDALLADLNNLVTDMNGATAPSPVPNPEPFPDITQTYSFVNVNHLQKYDTIRFKGKEYHVDHMTTVTKRKGFFKRKSVLMVQIHTLFHHDPIEVAFTDQLLKVND